MNESLSRRIFEDHSRWARKYKKFDTTTLKNQIAEEIAELVFEIRTDPSTRGLKNEIADLIFLCASIHSETEKYKLPYQKYMKFFKIFNSIVKMYYTYNLTTYPVIFEIKDTIPLAKLMDNSVDSPMSAHYMEIILQELLRMMVSLKVITCEDDILDILLYKLKILQGRYYNK